MNTDTKKTILIFLFVILTSYFALCFPYFYTFDGYFSNDQAIWGAFGSYIGGTIGTIISSSTLIIMALTIRLQLKLLKDSSMNLELARLASYIEQFKLAEQNIKLFLEKQCTFSLAGYPDIYNKEFFINNGELKDLLPRFNEDGYIHFVDLFEDIQFLISLISDAKKLNYTLLCKYYTNKYKTIISILKTKSYPVRDI